MSNKVGRASDFDLIELARHVKIKVKCAAPHKRNNGKQQHILDSATDESLACTCSTVFVHFRLFR